MLPCFFIICLLRQCSVLCFDCLCLCFLRHYTISSMFPLFHYLIVTSPYYLLKVSIVLLSVCYVTALFLLRLSMPLFLTSLYYFFNVSLVSLSVCYVTALFYASTVPSSVYHFTTLSLQGFHCFFICFLRRQTIYSMFILFHCLFCYVTALFYASTVSSSVSYVTILYIQGFNCFIICLLCHCSIIGFAGLFLCIFLLLHQ